MNHALDMKGKSIYNAYELSALTYAYTPTVGSTYINLSDASTSGATDLIIISGLNNFMAFNVANGINIVQTSFDE